MKSAPAALVVIVLAAGAVVAQDLDVASYDIEVALDAERHELDGRQTMSWRNTTSEPTSELWFHLYLNAFANTDTTFMRELRRFRPASAERFDGAWGWTRVTRLRLADGTDLLPDLSFERPDDGNESDFTVARVELPRAVMPGSSVLVELEFEARLPTAEMRTGYARDFHMVGQWFPKVGVFEGPAGWSCHQFHAASEFFADFGTYRVRLTIPRGWVLGATGEQISREPVGGNDVVEFIARDVHDFAWATAPPDVMTVIETDFEPGRDVPIEWLERARDRLGVAAGDLELPPTRLRLLVPRCQEALAPRMIRATRWAIAWFGLNLGPYPYSWLTVVSPPPGAEGAGGMEYPTLITTGAERKDLYPPFAWRPGIETVTIHEFGHQYFQGMVANDEVTDAWLDEGLVSWAENRCMEAVLAAGLAPGLRLARLWGADRVVLGSEPGALTVDRPSWAYRRLSEYYLASYTKTALALRTLERLIGPGAAARAMRTYVADNRFRHPEIDDLRRAFETASGQDLRWFFDEAIGGDAVPDWAVLAVRHRELEPERGWRWRDGSWWEPVGGEDTEDNEHPAWRVDVELGRVGDLVGPVEVELVWSDGRSERRLWEGRTRWVRWTEESPVRLERVVVDPDGVWMLETKRADNYWSDEATSLDRLWWLGHALRLAGLFVQPWS